MADYINQLKAEGYTSMRDQYLARLAAFPSLNGNTPSAETDQRLIDQADTLPTHSKDDNDVVLNIDDPPAVKNTVSAPIYSASEVPETQPAPVTSSPTPNPASRPNKVSDPSVDRSANRLELATPISEARCKVSEPSTLSDMPRAPWTMPPGTFVSAVTPVPKSESNESNTASAIPSSPLPSKANVSMAAPLVDTLSETTSVSESTTASDSAPSVPESAPSIPKIALSSPELVSKANTETDLPTTLSKAESSAKSESESAESGTNMSEAAIPETDMSKIQNAKAKKYPAISMMKYPAPTASKLPTGVPTKPSFLNCTPPPPPKTPEPGPKSQVKSIKDQGLHHMELPLIDIVKNALVVKEDKVRQYMVQAIKTGDIYYTNVNDKNLPAMTDNILAGCKILTLSQRKKKKLIQ